MHDKASTGGEVAITGVAITCALGNGTEEVWKAVRDGASGIRLTRRLDMSTAELPLLRRGGRDRAEPKRRPGPARPGHPAWRSAPRSRRWSLPGWHRWTHGPVPVRGRPGHVGRRPGRRASSSTGSCCAGASRRARRHHLLTYPLYTAADALSIAFGLKGPKVVDLQRLRGGRQLDRVRGRRDPRRPGRRDAGRRRGRAGHPVARRLRQPQGARPGAVRAVLAQHRAEHR